MNDGPVNAETLGKSLQDKIDKIDEAIVKARKNILVDISFMDREVAAICQQILKAEDNALQTLEPKMAEMINKLDELAEEIKAYQDRIEGDRGK